ncbi:MAG: tRNA pseudouridine(38-40) synthase TruA [Verrucomicrobia bacterium GWF2_51_19]|nr:MAG: tRNA pseudouridine(38-40) synthase TruA [Verrucomicrobia bacterium GWF2_51_19]HAD82582.1 tRNA pseudouridine(38-40) synthase TruA [Candidatus Edwardsbacteria bacterium]
MTRFKALCSYDGTDYCGWQSQVSGEGMQDYLERRLAVILGQPVRIHGSGRTDAGVHAEGQVFHFDGEWAYGPETLLRALRVGFPKTLQVISVEEVGEDFHARYSVTGKCYRYNLFLGQASPFEVRYWWSLGKCRLDVGAMQTAAQSLLGTHDFSAFGASRGKGAEPDNPVKDLRRLDVVQVGPRLTITTEASGYLYKMVRGLVGTLVEVGRGKLSPEAVHAILLSRQRSPLTPSAPAHGLTLVKVDY